MPISEDDLKRIDALLNAQLYYIKGSQRVTIIEQEREGKEIIIEDKLHPFRFWVVKDTRKWCFAISDDPNANPFWVGNGTEPGYGVQGIWPEGEEITEEKAKAIVEHHCQIYKQEYGVRRAELLLAPPEAKEKFSELARGMGWNARMTNVVKRFCRAAQEIAPYDTFNAWFAARGDQNRYLEEYARFKRMVTESQALDGYVGEKRADFLACEIDLN